jgi:NitT/TauT family transport system permease protein
LWSTTARRSLSPAVAVLVIAVVWQAVAWLSGDWVPGLAAIVEATFRVATTGETNAEVAVTSVRLAIAFVVTTVMGVLIGDAGGRPAPARRHRPRRAGPRLLHPRPPVAGHGRVGGGPRADRRGHPVRRARRRRRSARSRSRPRRDEPRLQLSRHAHLTEVVGRQLAPVVAGAARIALAFSWKVVVLMEALTQPDGIGAQIDYAFRLLRPADMIAYAILFMILMRLIEVLVLTRVERRLSAWNT